MIVPATVTIQVDDEEPEKPANRIPVGTMTPREIHDRLDEYIVGQSEAKRAVAIALRNRYRRHALDDDMKEEVIPKNILMIGAYSLKRALDPPPIRHPRVAGCSARNSAASLLN